MRIALLLLLFPPLFSCHAGGIVIHNDPAAKVIRFGNTSLQITLNCNGKCAVTAVDVNGQSVIAGPAGIYSSVTTSAGASTTLHLDSDPTVIVGGTTVSVRNIVYGPPGQTVAEDWTFVISERDIRFDIKRTFPAAVRLDEAGFPSFTFNSIGTWNGAFLSYGGLAWFYLFNEKLCTYGVHSTSSLFWNSISGNALKVDVAAPGKHVAMKYSRSNDDQLVYSVAVSDSELTPRYEAEKRSRFIRGKTNVWDSFTAAAGASVQSMTLSYIDYTKAYNRGTFVGEDGKQVTSVLNTIARIGVIDEKHFGGNSWHTPYGPICLHEQYIAQFAIGINDDSYVAGYKRCLDFYRDHAVQADGRVIARWAYLDSDAMPGTVTPQGFYEAQWGYLMDSNPDFVINVADLYNISGDRQWVATQKATCEKALEYMLRRDSNGNHLVEMMTSSQAERRGSDWIDIIWASHENAFVNAELYHALTVWSDVELHLHDTLAAKKYTAYAAALKESFNKPVGEGGFWSDHNKWYVHWLDKNTTVHGDNLVVPVNFMAIVYGICDDTLRRNAILDKIEEQTRKENLFFWPICLYPYAVGEGNDWQFPFPSYENGDLFLSWGSIGVEAYAGYKPEVAITYVDNVLNRYVKDGLAFQRYGRVNQDGLGDDILSGNSLALVGLYKAIYGINPLHNRLYLNPHLARKLSGTELVYTFRNEKLKIGLTTTKYSISNGQFTLQSSRDFGYSSTKHELVFYAQKEESYSLKAQTEEQLSVDIVQWEAGDYRWKQSSPNAQGTVRYTLHGAGADREYAFSNGVKTITVRSDRNGVVALDVKSGATTLTVRKQ